MGCRFFTELIFEFVIGKHEMGAIADLQLRGYIDAPLRQPINLAEERDRVHDDAGADDSHGIMQYTGWK